MNIKTANFSPAKSIKISDCFISNSNINRVRCRKEAPIQNILNISKPDRISFGGKTNLSGFYKIGEILLIDPATKKEVPAKIMSDLMPNNRVQNYCIATLDDEELGRMAIEHVNEPYEMSNNTTKQGYINVIGLFTKDGEDNIYKGVGTGLIYVALRQSFEAYEGRTKMHAYQVGKVSPIEYYKNLGFIPDTNGILNAESDINMHIPEENIEKWERIIKEMNALAEIDPERSYDKALSFPILNELSIPALFSALTGQFQG